LMMIIGVAFMLWHRAGNRVAKEQGNKVTR
jgi:hypothetical protein